LLSAFLEGNFQRGGLSHSAAELTLLFLSLGNILMVGFWAQPLVPNKKFGFEKVQEEDSG